MREIISFNITNTTNGVVPISILGNNSDEMDNSNESTRYAWDITGFTITNETLVAIQYNNLGISNFAIKSSVFSGTSIQNVIDALNSLIVGSFFVTTQSVTSTSIVNTSFVYGSGFNNRVTDFAIQSDGKVICVGFFTQYNGINASGIIRLNTDGTKDTSFVYGSGFNINVVGNKEKVQIILQDDGKILVGGNFSTYNVVGANRIIRLESNGSIDTSFVYGSGFNSFGGGFFALALQEDGKILVGGDFNLYNGVSANSIIRLESNGSIDTSFVVGGGFIAQPDVTSISIQSDGKIVCGGFFTSYQGVGANRIIRLESNGSIDTSFVYGNGFNTAVYEILLQNDGKILVGGAFTTYDGVSAFRIIRLESNGSIDTSFVYGSGFSNDVLAIAIQSDGKIICGGNFLTYKGVSSSRIIRLESNGSKDTSWEVGNGFNNEVYALTIKNNGNILVGGQFATFNTSTSALRIIELFPTLPTITSTFINNYNNNIAYGTLQIINPSQSASLTYSFNLQQIGQTAQIFVNTVLEESFATPSNANGSVPVVAGDVIDFISEVGNNPKGTQVFVYNLTTGQYLLNTTQTSPSETGDIFTIVANNSYLIGVNIN